MRNSSLRHSHGMKSRVLNFLTALSLLVCVAVVAVWAESYSGPRQVNGGRSPGVSWEVRSEAGRLVVMPTRVYQRLPFGSHIVRPGPRSQLDWLPGLRVTREEGRMRPRVPGEAPPYRFDLPTAGYASFARVEIGYWLPCLLSAALPALWLRRAGHRRRKAREAAGLCPSCGYDLRATPGRCPECGHTAARATT